MVRDVADRGPTWRAPRLLVVLALLGVVLGAHGLYGALGDALLLLSKRDDFVRLRIKQRLKPPAADKNALSPPPATQEAVRELVEREAELEYARRNVLLPLAAMGLILATLLFLGCARALRGEAWGLSAWTLAATLAIPYHVLDAFGTQSLLYALHESARGVAGPLGAMRLGEVRLLSMQHLFGTVLGLTYYAACALYLRRPAVLRLFPEPTEEPEEE
jgi:hypothetical protein